MKFSMEAEHRDALGRVIELGDLVVTLDANYRSGASFAIGICVGSTAKMLRVASARPSWSKQAGPEVTNRNLDKILVVSPEMIQSKSILDELESLRATLTGVGFVGHVI